MHPNFPPVNTSSRNVTSGYSPVSSISLFLALLIGLFSALNVAAQKSNATALLRAADELRPSPIGRDLRVLYRHSVVAVGSSISAEEERRFLGSFTKSQLHAATIASEAIADRSHEEIIVDFVSAAGWGVDHVLQLYIDRLQTCDVRDSLGQTPLFLAAAQGHLVTIQKLLANKADPNFCAITDGNNICPLHEAIRCKNFLVARLLVDAGADPTARNAEGQLPYSLLLGKEIKTTKPGSFLNYLLNAELSNQVASWIGEAAKCQAMRKALAQRLVAQDPYPDKEFMAKMAQYDGAIAENSASLSVMPHNRSWLYAAVPLDGPGRPITMQTMNGYTQYRERPTRDRYSYRPNEIPELEVDIESVQRQSKRLMQIQVQAALSAVKVTRLAFGDTKIESTKMIREASERLFKETMAEFNTR